MRYRPRTGTVESMAGALKRVWADPVRARLSRQIPLPGCWLGRGRGVTKALWVEKTGARKRRNVLEHRITKTQGCRRGEGRGEASVRVVGKRLASKQQVEG